LHPIDGSKPAFQTPNTLFIPAKQAKDYVCIDKSFNLSMQDEIIPVQDPNTNLSDSEQVDSLLAPPIPKLATKPLEVDCYMVMGTLRDYFSNLVNLVVQSDDFLCYRLIEIVEDPDLEPNHIKFGYVHLPQYEYLPTKSQPMTFSIFSFLQTQEYLNEIYQITENTDKPLMLEENIQAEEEDV
jgi:hypothetical protein